MRCRGLWVIGLVLVLLSIGIVAHKTPLYDYTKIAGVLEVGYHFQPRQPITNENITFIISVEHPGDIINGEITGVLNVYKDDSKGKWFAGKQYKFPDYLLLKKGDLEFVKEDKFTVKYQGQEVLSNRLEFTQDVIIDQPGSYLVTIDVYENGHYMGQTMHGLDIETPYLGPLYLIFTALIIVAVLWGVKARIL